MNLDIDRSARPDVVADLRLGLPLPGGRLAYVFSEHLLEHLSLPDGLTLLRDCRRALASGGVMRVAMPDLQQLVNRYLHNWRDQNWLNEPSYRDIDSAAHMLNYAMRAWGHLYVYDFAELERRLLDAGFIEVRRCEWGRSEFELLCGLERRPDSLLIVEAVA